MSADVRVALATARAEGRRGGIASLCTAHPDVLAIALAHAREHESTVLVEATCNQVNQEGGYTGLRPVDFSRRVEDIASRTGCNLARIVLGGDHLGPNPWKHLPADAALARADEMIDAYVEAGFTKIHLDASMGCAGEPSHLDDALVAERASRFVAVAEAACARAGGPEITYVIGTEVPMPGGAVSGGEDCTVTTVAAAAETLQAHRAAFATLGLDRVLPRVIALVVQPGVGFGDEAIVRYDRSAAHALTASLETLAPLLFEAHSTDYQTLEALTELVDDGFAILKVGPWLTYALREALYGLDRIAVELDPGARESTLEAVMESVMCANPQYWRAYYTGDGAAQRVRRHFSYSDRIRYYWTQPDAVQAVSELLRLLGERAIPLPLVGQYLGGLAADVAAGRTMATARALVDASVRAVIETYASAAQ